MTSEQKKSTAQPSKETPNITPVISPSEWSKPDTKLEVVNEPDPKLQDAIFMVQNQATVNSIAGSPQWLEKSRSGKFDQAMAVFDEMVEYRNSWVRFRWWGGGEGPTDKSNAKMELVDALHFSMSQMLAMPDATTESVANTLLYAYYASTGTPAESGPFEDERGAFKEYVAYTLLGDVEKAMTAFFVLCGGLDISWDHLVAYYKGKATLNKFRANNGYSTKTYIKNWRDGREDNYYLMAFIDEAFEFNGEIDVEAIQDWLEDEYRAVKASKAKRT